MRKSCVSCIEKDAPIAENRKNCSGNDMYK